MPGICDLPIPGASVPCGMGKAAGAVGQSATQSIAGNFIDSAAHSFAESLGKMVGTLLTFWTNVGVPNLSDPSGPVAFLRTSTSWIAAFVMIVSLIATGAKMAISGSMESGQHAAKGVWQMVLLSGAGVPAIMLLGAAGDQFSSWIIDRSTGGELGQRLQTLFAVEQLTGPMGSGLVLILALLGILSALGQMLLMIVRVGMLVLLAGMLPIAAAAAITKGGQQWLQKTLGWLLAWAAYKPAAAIVYAAAFAMVGKGNDPVTILSGLFLITLSILALPALIRLAVPATAAVASGGGGGGAAQAGQSMATGAIALGRGSSKSGGSGSQSSQQGGTSGPTGSSHPGRGGTSGGGGGNGGGTQPTGSSTSSSGASKAAGAAGPAGTVAAAGAETVQRGRQAAENATGNPTGSQEQQQ